MTTTTVPQRFFRNIVAVCVGDAIDGRTLTMAAALARAHGGQLTALGTVAQSAELDRLARHAGVDTGAITKRMIDDERARIAELADNGALGIPVEIAVRAGKPFLEIIGDAIENSRDLVVKPAEVFDGVGRHLFTSTDQHLLRKCPCPVWLSMPDAPTRTRSVLAAVDIADDTDDAPVGAAGLNGQIIDTALAIAQQAQAQLHVLHVWEAPAEDIVRRWSSDDDAALIYIRDTMARHEDALNGVVARARDRAGADMRASIHPHLSRGAPRRTIPQQVAALAADVLVMGTITRTGVPGLIIGNTAEDVLNAVDCSVVTVKPPGYVSPVAG